MTNYNLQNADPDKLIKTQSYKSAKLTLHSLHKTSVVTKTTILADISGSMSGHKLSCLKDALHKVWRPGIAGIAFNNAVWSFNEQDISQLSVSGTTKMLEALREAWQLNPGHIVLLTDGFADSGANRVLNVVAIHPQPPIDTIGIGDYDKDLLRRIAELTGGRFMDVNDPIQLSQTLQKLLDYRPNSL